MQSRDSLYEIMHVLFHCQQEADIPCIIIPVLTNGGGFFLPCRGIFAYISWKALDKTASQLSDGNLKVIIKSFFCFMIIFFYSSSKQKMNR